MTKIGEEDQRADFARLATQRELLLPFYDEQLRHRLSKRVGNVDPETIEEILTQAEAVRRRLTLRQGFERFLASHYPSATRISADDAEPGDNEDDNRDFLRSLGYQHLPGTHRTFAKELPAYSL